jgi:hypothetical protein
MTEKRARELLWFQTGGALNFITAAPYCRNISVFVAEIWHIKYTEVTFHKLCRQSLLHKNRIPASNYK